MSDIIQFDYKGHWKEEEINLERANNADKSLGFTIAGGIDRPYLNHQFTSIIVIHITENRLAYRNKRLKLYDIILRVNNFDFQNIKHEMALNILRTSGQKVQLLIRRLSPSYSEEIELSHNGSLGITIAGGIGSEYFQKDHGIFITDINKSQTNKQLDIGDRLLQISSKYTTYDLRFVTREIARKYIQLVCAESQQIKLYVGHTRPTKRVPSERTTLHQRQYDPYGSKDEDPVQINKNNYSTISDSYKSRNIESEHHYVNYETINTVLNERNANRIHNEQLIMSFDFDDYQRYENYGRVLENRLLRNQNINRSTGFVTKDEEQVNATKLTTASTVVDLTPDYQMNNDGKSFKLNDTARNTAIKQRPEQKLTPKEAAISDAEKEKLRRQQSRISQRARMNRDGPLLGGSGGLRWQVN